MDFSHQFFQCHIILTYVAHLWLLTRVVGLRHLRSVLVLLLERNVRVSVLLLLFLVLIVLVWPLVASAVTYLFQRLSDPHPTIVLRSTRNLLLLRHRIGLKALLLHHLGDVSSFVSISALTRSESLIMRELSKVGILLHD